jgi:hypothetical protein
VRGIKEHAFGDKVRGRGYNPEVDPENGTGG